MFILFSFSFWINENSKVAPCSIYLSLAETSGPKRPQAETSDNQYQHSVVDRRIIEHCCRTVDSVKYSFRMWIFFR